MTKRREGTAEKVRGIDKRDEAKGNDDRGNPRQREIRSKKITTAEIKNREN